MGELYSKPELFIKFRCQRCVLWQHVEKKIVMVELQKAAQSRVILPYVVHKHNQRKPIWSYALAAVMSNMMIVCIPGVVCWSNCAKIFGKLHFWGVNHQVHEQFIQAESLNEATQSQ